MAHNSILSFFVVTIGAPLLLVTNAEQPVARAAEVLGVQQPQDKVQDPNKAPVALTQGQDCTTAKCHGDLVKGRYVHGPVEIKRCTICHAHPDPLKHTFLTEKTTGKTCRSCHEMVDLPVAHKPVVEGDCTGCHDPHRSEHRALLKHKTESATCARCHEQGKLDKRVIHGPLAKGECNLCHMAHSSMHPKLLQQKNRELCFGCHTELAASIKHNSVLHKPVGENCSGCHDPHASDHTALLKDARPKLCLDCHEATRSVIADAKVYHEPLTEGEGCTNCHSSHSSKFGKLLNKPVMELCLQCHDKPTLREDGTVVKAMGDVFKNRKHLHGPIRDGECSGCHNPHGAKNFSLLRRNYPEKFYAPFEKKSYSLCFGCHDEKAFDLEKTNSLTRFRNGDLNLHFLHVNRQKKGRTCRACHTTHGSDQPKHVAPDVPFGSWRLPINYKETPRGGSCAPGCHKPKAYDIEKPVVYPTVDEPDPNKK